MRKESRVTSWSNKAKGRMIDMFVGKKLEIKAGKEVKK